MEAIKTRGEVNNNNQLIIQLPEATKAGLYELILVFLEGEHHADKEHSEVLSFSNYDLPVEGSHFSREEIYGDNGR